MTYVWNLDTIHAVMAIRQHTDLPPTVLTDPGLAADVIDRLAALMIDAAHTHAVEVTRDDLSVLDRRLLFPWGMGVTVGWWPRNRPATTRGLNIVGLIEIPQYTPGYVILRIHCTDSDHGHYTPVGRDVRCRITGWDETERVWVLEEAP